MNDMNNDTRTVNSVDSVKGHRHTLCNNCFFLLFFYCLLLWFLIMGVWGVKEVKKTASSILATKSATQHLPPSSTLSLIYVRFPIFVESTCGYLHAMNNH